MVDYSPVVTSCGVYVLCVSVRVHVCASVCVCACLPVSKRVGGAERVGLVSTHPHSKWNIEV